jgi:hypothetical protein
LHELRLLKVIGEAFGLGQLGDFRCTEHVSGQDQHTTEFWCERRAQ